MSSTLIFVGLPEDSKSSITKTSSELELPSVTQLDVNAELQNSAINTCLDVCERGVPNAPKSCIAEIFSADASTGSPVKNGNLRPRTVRDTPTRPRDTHSRLFGQTSSAHVTPMVTDTIRSNIKFGEAMMNGGSPAHSPKPLANGSASSTPSRATFSPPKRNPVTGDGVALQPPRRRHPAAGLREGNPITGVGYKSLNGQINTVTSVNGNSNMIAHSRVPPGGYSSGLW
ncbi:microtubule-associated protein Jupiter-like isoform X2 [Choristoneura fumiferana]|uniref:microtubule-associated protein Jupiter-like isoform X2 n=1 Tax=Choristoneura fumiferana TaxID=7141 RepID=UPI003D159D7B